MQLTFYDTNVQVHNEFDGAFKLNTNEIWNSHHAGSGFSVQLMKNTRYTYSIYSEHTDWVDCGAVTRQ